MQTINYLEKSFQIVVFENTLKKVKKKAFHKNMKGSKYNVVAKLFFEFSVFCFEFINTTGSIY